LRAALLERFDTAPRLSEVPDPVCPADGAVVEVRACGLCRSDHHAWKGVDPDVALPHVMGHEFAGVVVETGPHCTRLAPGDRVTAPFILGCGRCGDCRSGEPTICAAQTVIGFTIWGAFAERVALPAADFNLVRLPESLGFAEAAAMGCRVTTAWRALTERGGLRAGEWVAVHGCGGVGLSAVMLASALGARVVAVDVSEAALARAGALGAEATVDARGGDAGEAVRALTGGGAHLSVEALGLPATFEASLRSLRPLGRHVQIGMPTGAGATVPLPLLELVYARQLSLHGTRGLAAQGFGALLRMVEAGRIDLSGLVTRRIPLGALGEALALMDGAQPAGVTVVDRFDR
jgi:alcohol dehydrogenase